MVRFVEIDYIFKHPFEAVSRAYFQKVSFFTEINLPGFSNKLILSSHPLANYHTRLICFVYTLLVMF